MIRQVEEPRKTPPCVGELKLLRQELLQRIVRNETRRQESRTTAEHSQGHL